MNNIAITIIVAIFYPFGQFCEINISLPSLQKQPDAAPNLFQRGVEYGKYDYYHIMISSSSIIIIIRFIIIVIIIIVIIINSLCLLICMLTIMMIIMIIMI